MNLFIVGAGFSKALVPACQLNSDLLRTLAKESPSSAASMLRRRYNTEEIEIALTKLDVDIASRGTKTLRDLRRCLEDDLAHYFTSFRASEELLAQAPWLSKLGKLFATGDVVVSLNYDCMLEGVLDLLGKWSPRGGYGSSIENPLASMGKRKASPVTVLKIHGSANFVTAPYVDKPTSSAVNFIFDEVFFPKSAKNSHLLYGAGTGRGYVIAPSYVKIPTVEISYIMIDALRASSRARNLIVVGCGLRREDGFLTMILTNFLRQRGWRARRVVIVDPVAESIAERLNTYWGVNVSAQIVPIPGPLQNSVRRLATILRERGGASTA